MELINKKSFLTPSQAQYKTTYTVVEEGPIDPEMVYCMAVMMDNYGHLQMKIEWMFGGTDYWRITKDSQLARVGEPVDVSKVRVRILTQAKVDLIVEKRFNDFIKANPDTKLTQEEIESKKNELWNELVESLNNETDPAKRLQRWIKY